MAGVVCTTANQKTVVVTLSILLFCGIFLPCHSQNTTQQTPPEPLTGTDTALEPIYSMTDGFLRVVFPKSGLDVPTVEYVIKLTDEPQVDVWDTVQTILNGYAGFAACVVIGVLLIFFMPFIGCFCCCCRLCNNCGGKTHEHDPRYGKCKRVVCGLLLLVFTLLMLGGMVMIFFSGEKLTSLTSKNGEGSLPNAIKNRANDFQTTMNTVYNEDISNTLTDSVQELKTDIMDFLNGASGNFTNQLLSLISPNLTDSVENVIDDFIMVNGSVENIYGGLIKLDAVSDEAQTLINRLKSNSSQLTCTSIPCNEMKTKINELSFDWDITQFLSNVNNSRTKIAKVPDVNSEYEKAKQSISQKVTDELKSVKNDVANQTFPDVENQINNFLGQGRDLIHEIDNVTSKIETEIDHYFADEMVSNATNYGWWAIIALGSIVALIVVFFLLGVLIGGCGQRPGPDSPGCNKGVGANLILAGIGFSFIFYSLFMLLTCLLFIPGSLISSQMCWAIQDPKPLIKVLESSTLTFGNVSALHIAQGYSGCLDGSSVIESFGPVLSEFELSESQIRDLIDEQLKSLDGFIGNVTINTNNINILPDKLNDSLTSLTTLDFSKYNISGVIEEADRDPFNGALPGLLANVTMLKQSVSTTDKPILTNIHDILVELNSSTLAKARHETRILGDQVKKLEDVKIQGNATKLLNELKAAQTTVTSKGAKLAAEAIGDLANETKIIVKRSTNSAIDKVLGTKCDKLAKAARSLVNIGCEAVLDPYNALWFSFGWVVILMIPAIITGLCLASLYRRELPYDDNYYKDEMSDRGDNIPLESTRHGSKPGGYGYSEVNNGAFRDDYGRVSSRGGGYQGYQGHPPSNSQPYGGRPNGAYY